jgi:hypothetical protein
MAGCWSATWVSISIAACGMVLEIVRDENAILLSRQR